MHTVTPLGRLSVVLIYAGILAAACSSTTSSNHGGLQPSATFSSSECCRCVQGACATQSASCSADPDCATYLQCLMDCPPGETGDVSAECAGQCPAPQNAPGTTLKDSWATCEASAAAGACASCRGASTNPILTQQCAPSSQTDACLKCEHELCCSTWDAWMANDEALQFNDCLTKCIQQPGSNGEACLNSCASAHPDGVQTDIDDTACRGARCGDLCMDGPDVCSNCLRDRCSEPYADCFADRPCYAITMCVGDCATSACVNDCRLNRSEGALKLWNSFADCAINQCGGAC